MNSINYALEVNGLEKTYPQWRGESTKAVDKVSFINLFTGILIFSYLEKVAKQRGLLGHY
ncbi:MAG: hypothetical protein ACOC53_04065 [Candidatus Saliniplasma sp.]